ncbi:PaaI family thioesterase [Cupriavidus pauculus]|uniref:Acyl-CoA thioesterase n=1 Tax=Cupriavidus pauculus TaxID=82633 RepID=A0A2N5C6N9_9BURK|nr:PaaI family thioesterase [Cupriavidus pauculus]PLP97847.1 acyl-CoA thioesterase [Cupriavidus pauculus]
MSTRSVDPRNAAMLESVLGGSPVARSLGIRFDVVAPDHVELLLPFSMNHITVGDMVHGGVIATLIDVAGAAAAFSAVDLEVVKGGATGSLSIQFLAPAKSATLRAVADVVRRGKRQVVTEVSVYAEREGEAVLAAKALMSTALL